MKKLKQVLPELIFFALLTIAKHHSNILRLLNGTESRFDKKKKEETRS